MLFHVNKKNNEFFINKKFNSKQQLIFNLIKIRPIENVLTNKYNC